MTENFNFSLKPSTRLLAMFLLFLSAFGIRLYNIDKPPLDFAPIRQYQVAHIARNYYLQGMDSIQESKKEIAKLNAQRMGFELEPRIMEHMAVLGYRLMGGEYLWIPRMMSSLFWIIGGIFVYMIAKKLFSFNEAVFSAVFYLFLPYSISASRSFQPDPLMVMLMICGFYFILKYFERPSLLILITAAVTSTLAMLLKPNCAVFIFGAFISLAILKYGFRRFILKKDLLIFSFLSLLPAASFYLRGLITNSGFVQEHARSTFVPHLILQTFFWKDWAYIIGIVFGYIPFTGALIGLFMLKEKTPKFMLSGLWIAYFIFGLLFTFHIHTHSYYQLPFIPVVALSIGPFGSWSISELKKIFSRYKLIVLFITGVLVLSVPLALNSGYMQFKKYKDELRLIGSFIGLNTEIYHFITSDFEKEVKISREIGELVKHSKNTLFLTHDFGRSLAYHGELSGLPWPISASLREREERGVSIPPKEELFNEKYLTVRALGKYIHYTPDYFIVTALDEFYKQNDLRQFMIDNFPLIQKNEDYLIFDLRKMSEGL